MSSPLVAVAVVVRVVFVARRRRRRRRRLYPHPRPSPPVLVVALSCVRLCPTAILTPRPSPPARAAVQSCHPPPPLSSPESSRPRPPPHRPAPLPETRHGRRPQRLRGLGAWGTAARLGLQWRLGAAAFVGAWALQRGWGAAGSCCERGQLNAAAIVKARGGCSGSEAVVVAASSSPCRRVPASARLGGNISVATFGPCRCVVTSSSRRVVAASSSPRHRRRRRRRRVVARLYPHPPALTTSGRRAVVSSVPASILSASPSSAGRRRRSSPLVVVARRRRSSPRRREVSTNVSTSASTQVPTWVSTKRYPHRPPVLVVACHPSPPLSSPHPRGVSDCGSEAGAAATVSAWG